MSEIDVSKCKFYDSDEVFDCTLLGCQCNGTNCHFRQLQKVKKENKELWKKVEELDKSYDFICKQLNCQADLKDKVKAKIDKIKEIVNGNYYVLDPVALQEIRKIVNE